jgi:hypothetical protein
MKFRYLLVTALLVGATLRLPAQSAQPTIAHSEGVFTVEFPAGASFVSVVFDSTKEDYTARKNAVVDTRTTSLAANWSMVNCYWGGPTDCPSGADWRVWAEVHYENPDRSHRELKTNVLTVRH